MSIKYIKYISSKYLQHKTCLWLDYFIVRMIYISLVGFLYY